MGLSLLSDSLKEGLSTIQPVNRAHCRAHYGCLIKITTNEHPHLGLLQAQGVCSCPLGMHRAEGAALGTNAADPLLGAPV